MSHRDAKSGSGHFSQAFAQDVLDDAAVAKVGQFGSAVDTRNQFQLQTRAVLARDLASHLAAPLELRESAPLQLRANAVGTMNVELGVTSFASFDVEVPDAIKITSGLV